MVKPPAEVPLDGMDLIERGEWRALNSFGFLDCPTNHLSRHEHPNPAGKLT